MVVKRLDAGQPDVSQSPTRWPIGRPPDGRDDVRSTARSGRWTGPPTARTRGAGPSPGQLRLLGLSPSPLRAPFCAVLARVHQRPGGDTSIAPLERVGARYALFACWQLLGVWEHIASALIAAADADGKLSWQVVGGLDHFARPRPHCRRPAGRLRAGGRRAGAPRAGPLTWGLVDQDPRRDRPASRRAPSC